MHQACLSNRDKRQPGGFLAVTRIAIIDMYNMNVLVLAAGSRLMALLTASETVS